MRIRVREVVMVKRSDWQWGDVVVFCAISGDWWDGAEAWVDLEVGWVV